MTRWDFAGKVILITGGGSGIGRSAARLFAGAGAHLMLADRDVAGLEVTVGSLPDAAPEAHTIAVDVTREADAERMVAETVAAFGRIDHAVNSAGVGGHRWKTADYPIDIWRRIVEVNLTGVFLSMRFEIPAILESGGGSIVNLASVAGVMGFANHAAYAASKHGVIGLTRSAALEYAKKGVRVNAVCPAFTLTPMVEALIGGDAERRARIEAANPSGRLGEPDEIATSIAYLCSEGAAFITGQSLVLDGGLSIG